MWAEIALAVIGTGVLSELVNKIFNRGILKATAKKTDVDALRGIIAELQEARATDQETISQLTRRVGQLEERERHMLVRAAVHEAWDQMAFQALLAMNPNHPPPPPLSLSE